MKKLFCFLILTISNIVSASDQINIAGSATIYPFITLAVEQFTGKTNYNAPIVENIGTGGGIKLFCSNKINIAAASRKIKSEEIKYCNENNILENNIGEIIIGYDGIVIAHSKELPSIKFNSRDMFLAFAKNIPDNGKMIPNPYSRWNEINPSLPNSNIEIYGPSHSSGTRDAIIELLIGKYCENLVEIKAIYPDQKQRHLLCKAIREDGKFIEVGDNYNLIIQKIKLNNKAFGIFGFNFYNNNTDIIQSTSIDNISPSYGSIASRYYKLSRALYLYYQKSELASNPMTKAFIEELVSEDATGDNGYLTKAGLVTKGK